MLECDPSFAHCSVEMWEVGNTDLTCYLSPLVIMIIIIIVIVIIIIIIIIIILMITIMSIFLERFSM